MTTPTFYATYLQYVNRETGQRDQRIVTSPVKNSPAIFPCMALWRRSQTLDNQRPRWEYRSGDPDDIERWIRDDVNRRTRDRWIVAEPITVRTNAAVITRLMLEGKTPYLLISSLQRIARNRGIVIAGPTSVPEVVASPASS